jgi:pyruvate carboxylase
MPYRVRVDNVPYQLEIEEIDGQKQKFLIKRKGRQHVVEAFSSSLSQYTLLIDNQSFDVYVSNGKQPPTVFVNGSYFQIAYDRNADVPNRNRTRPLAKGPMDIQASMPGKIVKILVKVGQKIEKGQALLVLEAMKMENEIAAPQSGTLKAIHVDSGQSVENGQKLVTLFLG